MSPTLAARAATQSTPSRSEDSLALGIRLLSSGHYAESIEAFNRFKQTAPDDGRPYFFAGMAYTQDGKLSDAAAELKEAVRLAPDKPEYRIFQANALTQLRQKLYASNALTIFKKPGVAEQMATPWLQLLADVYFRLEQNEDALRTLDILSARNPHDPRTDYDRGRVYVIQGNLDRALDSFRKSVEESPHNPDAYFEIGKILYQRNDPSGAKNALVTAFQQEGSRVDPDLLLKLGDVSLALGEVREAIEYLKRAEPEGTALPAIYYALGRAYQHQGDRAKGEAYREKFQAISEAQAKKKEQTVEVDKLVIQGEALLDQRRQAEARTAFEKAVQADPSRWEAHGYVAEMDLASGDLPRAYEHIRQMERLEPESPVGNFLAARYWYASKQLERARAYAEKVKVTRPGNSELRNLLGNIYLAIGERDKAIREYEAAVRLAPDRGEFRENLQKAEKSK